MHMTCAEAKSYLEEFIPLINLLMYGVIDGINRKILCLCISFTLSIAAFL